MIALALLLAAAPAGAPSLAETPAMFQRAEPNLEAGARALANGDVDGALESFRRAQPESDDQRAIIEYDVGAALLARAALTPSPAGGAPSTHADPAPAPPDGAEAGPDTAALDDARAAFERAYGIARDRRLKSEAALASGNAAALANKLDDAIAQYRKAVVADPSNARAKTNLQRALAAKRAQPPPPPDQGDQSDDEKKGEDQGDKNQGDEKKPGDKGDDTKPDDKKGDDGKPDDKKGDDKPDDKGDDKKGDDKKGDQQSGPAQKKKLKKDEARRLLEMMRARERPLTPMEMRGEQKAQAPKQGKDW